ncbi:unnamed protein product [Gordionus sp. m RMFG-2023]|uniref:uncharacterized protein LOC135929960 isoform X2 n=1 Tax=Gordionus sp. m RMFG-2023 TaxID=3053472 RepID=UPI0030E21B67
MLQYKRCNICGLNFTNYSQHSYQKYHKRKINDGIKRFKLKKIKANEQLINMSFIPKSDLNKKFWCIFCSKDYEYNYIVNNYQILALGFFDHISKHMKFVKKILLENGEDMKDINSYINDRKLFTEYENVINSIITKANDPIQLLKYTQSCDNSIYVRKSSPILSKKFEKSIKPFDTKIIMNKEILPHFKKKKKKIIPENNDFILRPYVSKRLTKL